MDEIPVFGTCGQLDRWLDKVQIVPSPENTNR